MRSTSRQPPSRHAHGALPLRAATGLLVTIILAGISLSSIPDPDPDLDIDSDNNNGLTGYPDRSEAEDAVEDIAGDPEHPGKLVMVNDDDDDGDGIPDFADGFNLNLYWEDPPGRSDDANWYENDFVPVVLEIPEPIDLNVAIIYFSYDASDPLWCYSWGDPPVYTPGSGWLRLWRGDYSPRSPLPCTQWDYDYGCYGDFVPPDYIEPWQLDLDNSWRTVTLYLEALWPSAAMGDSQIMVLVDPDGWSGPEGFTRIDTVRVTCVRADIDIDSDNTEQFAAPARTDEEDQGEEVVSDDSRPGKVVLRRRHPRLRRRLRPRRHCRQRRR